MQVGSSCIMIGVLCSMSLLLSMAHLPTLTLSLLSLGADRSCGSPLCIVVTGGTWGLQLALAEHPAHVPSLGAHGGVCGLHYPCHCIGCGALRCTLVEGPLYHPIVIVIGGAQWLRLTLPLPGATLSSSWSVAYGNCGPCWQGAIHCCDIIAVRHPVHTRVVACIGRAGPTPHPHVGVPSSGVHGGYCSHYHCRRHVIIVVVGITCGLQLALVECFLVVASSWL